MTLDNEQQRQQLLACIDDTYVAGPFHQVMKGLPAIAALRDTVASAPIEEASDGGK